MTNHWHRYFLPAGAWLAGTLLFVVGFGLSEVAPAAEPAPASGTVTTTQWGAVIEAFNSADIPQAIEQLTELGQAHNYAPAANVLGALYLQGQVVPQDYLRAREWLERASSLGSAIAQYNLGVIHANGYTRNSQPNPKDAFFYFSISAEQNFSPATLAVAKCYYFGIGVAQDMHQSFRWFLAAAKQGESAAMPIVAELYSKNYSSSLPRPLSWLMLVFGIRQSENRKSAFYWARRSAIQGNPLSQYNVAVMYERGFGTKRDEQLSLQYLNNAAEQGMPLAASKLKKLGQQP